MVFCLQLGAEEQIDIPTGEAGHGARVKKEAFGSLQDLISEPNQT